MRKGAVIVLLAAASLLTLPACREKGPAEKAGEEIDKSVEKAKEKTEEAADKVGDAAKDAANKVEDAAKK
jgi:predicted small lipoprotein YifL